VGAQYPYLRQTRQKPDKVKPALARDPQPLRRGQLGALGASWRFCFHAKAEPFPAPSLVQGRGVGDLLEVLLGSATARHGTAGMTFRLRSERQVGSGSMAGACSGSGRQGIAVLRARA
jgi:hypothetical protein